MGIEIKIGEKWVLKSDSIEFSLYRLGFNKKKNTPTETCVGHYSCLDHCLKWLINKDIAASDCESLGEVIEHIENFRKLIDESLGIGIPDYSLESAQKIKGP